MDEIMGNKFFRVWYFDRNENKTIYSYDGYEDVEHKITFNFQGACFIDLTEDELTCLRLGLQHSSKLFSKAILVRDLRKQDDGTYDNVIDELVSCGVRVREAQAKEAARREAEASRRKLKSQANAKAKKEAQLKKLQRELSLMEEAG